MGVIVKQKIRGKGKPWWIFIHHEGRTTTKKIGDRRSAELVATEVRKRLKVGELNLPVEPKAKLPTFAEYSTHYIETYAKGTCKPNTWKGYEAIIRYHLLGHWKHRRMDDIRRPDVKQLLLAKQRSGLSPKSVENIKALISGIFTQAVEEEVLQVNPALRLGRFIQKQDRKRHVKPLTREQASNLLATAKVDAPEHYAMLLTALRTGMRLGEVVGLAWEDINFASDCINVQRSYSGGAFSTPKSRKSRIVDMSDQLKTTLLDHQSWLRQHHRGRLPTVQVIDGKQRDCIELVFPNRNGNPLCSDNFRARIWGKLLKDAELPPTRIHDLRHTFASLLLANGEPLHYVKEQMGHASIQTTVDVYGHLVQGSNRQAVNRLDDESPALRLVTGDVG